MLTTSTQLRRELAVFTPLGDDVVLRRVDGTESISELFEFQLELLSEDSSLQASDILGCNMTFTLRGADDSPRYFNGYVNRFACAGQAEQATTYRATVVPWLWFLTQTTDCRISQNKTAPEIIEKIFQDLGFTDYQLELSESYAPREYCVQYRETDFAFVSRLMEEEGIFYFFNHENGKHNLILGDSLSCYAPMDESSVDFADPDARGDLTDQLTDWRHVYQYHSGGIAQRDYNFLAPSADLTSEADTQVQLANINVFQRFDYPGIYEDDGLGSQRTKVRMEAEETKFDNVQAAGTYRSFTAGGRFKVRSHVNSTEIGKEYFVTSVRHTASVGGAYVTGSDEGEVNYKNEFGCMPASVIFRPQQTTQRPIVEGIQTAVIVGPAGEEIHTDEYGRVKVQFPWDREGDQDENSSCWMRVSQHHAGHGWGNMDLPRIGEEVVVSFLEGNPDRPIIKGRVYNGNNRPPFGLPAEKTRSEGKTDTYQGSGYNEMSSDDTPGAEQIRTNAQHNMDSNVNNSQTLTVGVDRSEDIVNNDALTIGVDASEEIGNDKSIAVGNDQDIDVAGNIEITAGMSITLSVGASTIHMNQAGVITISGQYVTSAAMATNSTVAPMTEVVGSNVLNQAGLICLDVGGIKHIKGGETSISGASTNVEGGTVVVKGAPIALGEAGAPIAELPAPSADGGGPAGPDAPSAPGGGGENAPSSARKQEKQMTQKEADKIADIAEKDIEKKFGDYIPEDKKNDGKGSDVVKLTTEQDQDRLCNDREKQSAGCYIRDKDKSYIDVQHAEPHLIYHELMHRNGSKEFHTEFRNIEGVRYSEGVTEYFTRQVSPGRSYNPYEDEVNEVRKLLKKGGISEETLKRAYFSGERRARAQVRRAIYKTRYPDSTIDPDNRF